MTNENENDKNISNYSTENLKAHFQQHLETINLDEQHQFNNIGEILVSKGVITDNQLNIALEFQKTTSETLGNILVNLEYITHEHLLKFISTDLGITAVSLKDYTIQDEVIRIIPEKICRKYTLIPLYKVGKVLTVAMADPFDIVALDDIKMICGLPIEPVTAAPNDIESMLDDFYRGSDELNRALNELNKTKPAHTEEESMQQRIYELGDSKNPLINLVNLLILNAVNKNASDIHIEPFKNYIRIRYRIDGILIEMKKVDRYLFAQIISRIKVMGDMDISEKRKPQDGNIAIDAGGKKIDLRISTFPTIYGEKVVIRILNPDASLYNLQNLGMEKEDEDNIRNYLRYSHGMIIITGPTGSGKTTTLYSALHMLNSDRVNISTIEDPVEYHFNNINQMQVNHELGISFSTGLRTLMRQDPDIILVGEVRDDETAKTAVQSALTGHLVFTSLHTNSSSGAFHRLINFGVDPFLINSSVICVVAQRLLRKVCTACRKETDTKSIVSSRKVLTQLPKKIFTASDCSKCFGTGFSGRTGIFEVLSNSVNLHELIEKKSNAPVIQAAAVKGGMTTLFQNGLKKVASGETTYDEILRITYGIQ